MQFTGKLEAISSRTDSCGNREWAMRYTDFATGKVIGAKISGGDSNIMGIRRHWNVPDGWDDSLMTESFELKIREFNRLTKGWPHAGCRSEDLANWLRQQLAKD